MLGRHVVNKRGWNDGNLRTDGGFEQRRFEGEHAAPTGAGALEEKHEAQTAFQRWSELASHAGTVPTPLAVDKTSARHSGKPAENGPAAHFPFGNKDAG